MAVVFSASIGFRGGFKPFNPLLKGTFIVVVLLYIVFLPRSNEFLIKSKSSFIGLPGHCAGGKTLLHI